MCVWTSRRDARGARSFISYTPRAIEMLVPPGATLPGELAERSPVGAGLWILARWPRTEGTLVDVDEPQADERLRTAAVLAHVGDGLRGEVAEIMQEQLNYAWMLCDPHPARLVEDRRAHRHAALLMQTTLTARPSSATARRLANRPRTHGSPHTPTAAAAPNADPCGAGSSGTRSTAAECPFSTEATLCLA